MSATVKHIAGYALYRAVEGVLRYLPWNTALAIGEAAGSIAYWADRRHRNVVLENIQKSDLGFSRKKIVQTAKECFRHFGALSFTLPQLLFMDAETLTDHVLFQGIEHWDAARSSGKGFIGLTGHYGNWEAMALTLSASGRPLAVIGRKLSNPLLDSRLRALRTRFGNRTIDKSGAMKECVKTLREGMGVGFLLDQDARSNGVFTKFMGRWASTYPTAAALALRFDLPVVPIFSYPCSDGTIIVRAEPALVIPRSGDNEKDILTATQLMSTALERQVRRLPHVWFWMHRRFKTQPQPPT
ncbi:MAG: lysophospholipid acyltransferase family protein [Holophagales bacterium]|jgi:KDO2-lipid IV(A) lauroyltransferase|nr:lysophospholipid acyltransferase family protein [Holophagales bacterium]